MGKITLYIFILLVPIGVSLENEGSVVSGVQPTKSFPNTTAMPASLAPATGSDPVPTSGPQTATFPPGGVTIPMATTADQHKPVDGVIASTIFAFLLMGLLVCACCCTWMLSRLKRTWLARRIAAWAAPPSREDRAASTAGAGDGSDQSECSDDTLTIRGMSSAIRKQPVVKFRRGKPGRPTEPMLSSEGDVLDL